MSIRSATLNGVATIEIARPEKKNALTVAMYQAMADALTAASADKAVRAVLITGQPGIFTSGNDLEDFMQRPRHGADSPVFQFMKALLACDKPVVAAVTGAAIGIGTTIAERFNALPPGAVRDTKQLLRRGRTEPVMQAIAAEAEVFGARLKSPEAREAFSAFFEKRRPDFSRFE
jgi:enoyl-CoA hydratase/carnithine racemase